MPKRRLRYKRLGTVACWGFVLGFSPFMSFFHHEPEQPQVVEKPKSFVFDHTPFLPDPNKTPGEIMESDLSKICVHGYSRSVRKVSKNTKDFIHLIYGVPPEDWGNKGRQYQIDHLIPLAIGGSNSPSNLWSQQENINYRGLNLGKSTKTRLENFLHKAVCDRT